MTEGNPVRLMISFSLPLLLVSVMQLLFTVVDVFVLGRLLGWKEFASVGSATALHWMSSSAIQGMTHGFSVLFAQRFGAKDPVGLRKSFATGIILSLVLGAVVTLIGIFACRSILDLIGTSEILKKGAADYLIVFFIGAPIVFIYNLFVGMIRALGDGRTTLFAMILMTLLKITLNFAMVFPFGIPGVSAATILAQFAASLYCFLALKKSGYLQGDGFRWDTPTSKKLLRLGLPLSFRNAVIEVGGLIVQRYINAYEETFVAGIAAARRMYDLLLVAANAVEAAVATFVAQNFGAGKLDRVRRGVRDGLKMMMVSVAVTMAVTLPFGRWILSLLIEGSPASIGAILDAGTIQLTVNALCLPLLCLLLLYRSSLQSVGNTLIPTASGFVELVMQVSSVAFLTPVWSQWGVFMSDASGWLAASSLLATSFYIVYKKRVRAATA